MRELIVCTVFGAAIVAVSCPSPAAEAPRRGYRAVVDTHTIAVHAANATVQPAEMTVKTEAKPVPVTFTLTAQTAGQTVAVLAEIDRQHGKKWELSAVAE